jgi:hypothetical protein
MMSAKIQEFAEKAIELPSQEDVKPDDTPAAVSAENRVQAIQKLADTISARDERTLTDYFALGKLVDDCLLSKRFKSIRHIAEAVNRRGFGHVTLSQAKRLYTTATSDGQTFEGFAAHLSKEYPAERVTWTLARHHLFSKDQAVDPRDELENELVTCPVCHGKGQVPKNLRPISLADLNASETEKFTERLGEIAKTAEKLGKPIRLTFPRTGATRSEEIKLRIVGE